MHISIHTRIRPYKQVHTYKAYIHVFNTYLYLCMMYAVLGQLPVRGGGVPAAGGVRPGVPLGRGCPGRHRIGAAAHAATYTQRSILYAYTVYDMICNFLYELYVCMYVYGSIVFQIHSKLSR